MPEAIWRAAGQDDRGGISVFVCTEPAKPKKSLASGYKPHHPRKWEYEAQQIIRSLARKVPCQGAAKVYVALDDQGIAAVVSWTELDGPAVVSLDVIGIAMRHRRQKSDFAQSISKAAAEEIESAALEAHAEELYVEGHIYCLNDASQAIAARMGLTKRSEAPTGYQTWSIRVPLAGADVGDGHTGDES